MGRAGWAASVTAISPAGLWRKPLGDRRVNPRLWAKRLRPFVSLALRTRRTRESMLATFAAQPDRIPAKEGRELVLGWIDASGYDGANRAMRTHVFDPAGYPDLPVTLAWGERDRLLGAAAARAPAGRRALPRPARRRPHADVGRPGADRRDPARGQLGLGRGLTVLGEFRDASNRRETRVIIERTENPQWLSNAYLVADEAGGKGVLIDGNDDLGPLLERAERDGIEITHILDHPPPRRPRRRPGRGAASSSAACRWSPTPRRRRKSRTEVAQTIADGEKLSTGGLEIEAIYTPGHAAGHVAFLVNGSDVFTADVLFKGTVGGTMAPGASGFDDLESSVMRLMELPPETVVHPGHREPTTIGEEREANPFVQIWRGEEETGDEQVTVWGRPATLKLWAPDYDGGNKAWIVFGDDGTEAIVGGSQVERG